NGNNITDDPIPITVYENGGNTVLFTFEIPFIDQEILEIGDLCFSPQVCVEQKNYRVTQPLPPNPNGYYFAWERCCRNEIITNVQDPGDWGMVFTFSMPDPLLQNSSPVFDEYPARAYFCSDATNNLSFTAFDADGDSLVYSLDDPRTGAASINNITPPIASPAPYMAVPWETGFNSGNMVGGSPAMAIDPISGNLTASPDILGVYVFAIKVEEYRNGVKIGEVRRELQFDTFICPEDNPSAITWDEDSPETYTIEPNKPFCIDVLVEDVDLGDTLFLFANSSILDTAFFPQAAFLPVDSINDGDISSEFCWVPNCDNISPVPYEIVIQAFSSGCADSTIAVSDSFNIIVELPEDNPTEMVFPFDQEEVYVMNGEQHCFDLILQDPDCYDTLTFKVDTTQYIFSTSPSPGSFEPIPPSLFGSFAEFCWIPVCEDVNEPGEVHELNFFVESKKCSVTNVYNYPFTVQIIPETDGSLALPNIFTPDDDMSNPYFKAHENLTDFLSPDFCIDNFSLTIFNRWGTKVFESNDKFFEWDGTFQDSEQECAPGVYYYIISYDVFDRSESYRGDLTLIR
ncbi:MAG: gliding motility-associated C-terminal domain-containing protein, partial [Bacteroidota bacterium]